MRNAFEIMHQQQVSEMKPDLDPETDEKTSKDRMRNSLIRLVRSKRLFWRASESKTRGEHCIQTLKNVLWYIDGHHDTLKKQSQKIPGLFETFTGYNVPEKSKHRKRTSQNLDQGKLSSYASDLFELLLAPYRSQTGWIDFRKDVVCLANSIREYAELLCKQNFKVKALHSFPIPVRSLSDRLSVTYLKKVTHKVPDAVYSELNADVLMFPLYQPFALSKYLPLDKHKRYLYIHQLRDNLSRESMLNDSPGNNTGNAYYLIPVEPSDPDATKLEQSQQAIEEIKVT